MKTSVYVETSVISYLTARDSKDPVKLARQKLTREWWEHDRRRYRLVIGQPVLDEISNGDPGAARRRVDAVKDTKPLPITVAAKQLAERLVQSGLIPQKERADAEHISVASIHGIDFLITWNFSHLSNGQISRQITELIRQSGYKPPFITTLDILWRNRK